MNKLFNKYLILFMFIFVVNINFCHASKYLGTINGTGVKLRSGPGTNYENLKSTEKESQYYLVDNTLYPSEKDCSKGWYKVYYEGGSTAYLCSDYVEVKTLEVNDTPTNECEQALYDLGFPASYWPNLCALKTAHPNWQFKPIQTNLEWSEVVEQESACGQSYIASSIPTNIDTTCINQYTKTWYPASPSAVAYYMDPRNWLNENHIFQFEYLKYDTDLESLYTKAVESVIDHANFYTYHLGIGNNLSEIINVVSKETNVSPVFVASRILQEMGSGESLYNLYSGVYEGFLGFYNFYNFGVNDACATSKGTTLCGLEYAQKNNWYGLNDAIKGGASQIASSYIDKGQYTTYLQKFNVVPLESNKLYAHQYMTNIAAPSSEAKTAYKTYKELGLLDNVFVFYIPIYNNMDDKNYSDTSGAVDVPETETQTTIDISTIITSSGYKLASSVISGIALDTSVSTFKGAIESVSGSNSVIVKNQNDVAVTDGLVGTGYKVTVNTANSSETYTLLINGDTSGDGKINALDLLQVQKNILGTYSLNDVYFDAGDTSGDGQINALDLLQVQKSILGTFTINQ